MTKLLCRLRMDEVSPSAADARRIASTQLRTRGLRLHLILAALLTLAFWVGCLYLTENIFAVVPWVALYEDAYTLFVLLNVLYYTVDVAVAVCLGFGLLYGCATVFYAASRGEQLPLTALFCAFESGRRYGRAITVMVLIAFPRAIAVTVLRVLWQQLTTSQGTGVTLLWLLLTLAFFAAATILFGLDDAYLPLALAEPHENVLRLYRRSVRLSSQCLVRIWLYKLTYLGWGLLSVLTLGVLLIGHALPHYTLSHTIWTGDTYRKS